MGKKQQNRAERHFALAAAYDQAARYMGMDWPGKPVDMDARAHVAQRLHKKAIKHHAAAGVQLIPRMRCAPIIADDLEETP